MYRYVPVQAVQPMTLPIILCMIVRDEADTIAGVLEAARPYVDGFAIVDTGSVDGTVEECRRAVTGLQGFLVDDVRWPGRFDVARTFVWHVSHQLAPLLGASDHLRLELSGDSYLSGELNRSAITEEIDALTITSHMGPITWKRPKLTRSGRGWVYRGRLHETVVMEDGRSPVLADSGLHIEHRGKVRQQGGRSEYVAMMMADLEEHPDDPRTVFYAAQTLDTAGRWGEARALYEQRIRMGGWDQERYIAALRVARRAVADGWPSGPIVALANRAIGICPSRPEAWELWCEQTGSPIANHHLEPVPATVEEQANWLFYEPKETTP